jgi:hypothetical protein
MLPVLGHFGLLCIFDLAERWPLTLLCVAIGFLGLLLAGPQLRGQTARSRAGLILAVALLLRVFLLPVLPSLSDDVYRYIWDGRVVGAGLNPYVLAPEAPELVPLRDDLWTAMSHHDVPTVYPPLAQALFTLSARLPAPVYALKAILALLDLGACALLLMLAGRWNLPLERTIWYAWNPLVTVEIAGMGHVDGLGVALVILATTLLAWPGRHLLSGAVAAAGAVLAKLVPVLAIPIWARQSGRSASFAAVALALSLAGLIPVFWSTSGPPPGLVEYGVSWEFNGPLFEPLWRIIDRVDVHGPVQAGLDRLKDLTGRAEPWDHLYHYNYPQFWAKVLLLLGLLISLVFIWRSRETLFGLRRVFGAVVIFSATVYPWYALWVLPWAALSRDRAWLSLSALLFLSYLPQFLDVPLFPWIHALIWLPFAMLLVSDRR